MARLNAGKRSPSTDSLYRDPTPGVNIRLTQQSRPDGENTSPARSFSSDKENNYGAAQSTKPTGKSKAMMPPNTNASQHANKRRRLEDRQTENRDTPFTLMLSQYPRGPETDKQKFFNPEQNEDLRRGLRAQMRTNTRELHDRRNDLQPQELVQLIRKEDRVMGEVRQTSDATIDSRFLLEASDVALKKSTSVALGNGSIGIDVDEFVSKCISFMRNGGLVEENGEEPRSTQMARRRRQTQAGSDDEGEDGDALAWDVLGEHACFPCNRRPPVPSFLLGPLSVEKRIRNTQRSVRQRRDPQVAVTKPQELLASDLAQNESSSITKVCQELKLHLDQVIQDGVAGVDAEGSDEMTDAESRAVFKRNKLSTNYEVSLFEYAINPKSFGQTVENLFHISFLVKDGFVRLSFDDDGLPTIRTDTPRAVNDQHETGASRHQAIFTLDFGTWQKLITAFDIKHPLIPHRAEETTQVTAGGWYS